MGEEKIRAIEKFISLHNGVVVQGQDPNQIICELR